MPFDELAGRLSYTAYTACERGLHRAGYFSRPHRLRSALTPDLSRAEGDWRTVLLQRPRKGAFFASVSDLDTVRAQLLHHYPAEVDKARIVSDTVAKHQIEFFGERFSFGPRIDWHADPVTHAPWPKRYHRDVPTGKAFGDVKHVWELNRHQFLVDLAKRFVLDSSKPHLRALHTMVEDWQREAPYGTGVAWACALEPAFRVWSWLWAYELLRAADALEPDFHITWLTGFFDHGRFLHRHLETFTSPYNHLIGEASALFALGLLFPEFREAPAWAARGRGVLESTLGTQFHSDGGSVEQSTFYHHATLGFYLLSAILARRNGCDLSADVWQTIERGIEFSTALVQPDGRVPRIGGADDGKPIRLEHLPFFDFRPYQAIGAVLFRRGDFKAVAGRFWEDALWVLGPEGADCFDALAAETPPLASSLPETGYYIVRTSWSDDADYLLFDCGPQAAGLRRDAVPSAAHGHADCLSVIAFLAGRPVLIDPGFYCYNCDPEWEVHFRRTGAHNTVMVDGLDQAHHVHKMAWIHTYAPNFELAVLDGDLGWVRGSHDGFSRLAVGLVHRRTAWLRPGGYVVILDELLGGAGHTARANFQFAPGTLALASDASTLFEHRFELAWAASTHLMASVVTDGETVSGGWIAPSLGVRQRAPRLVLDLCTLAERTLLLTVLADRMRQPGASSPRVSIEVEGESAVLAATIAGAGWMDRVVASAGSGVVHADGLLTDAPLALVRNYTDGREELRQIGGSYVRRERPAGSARQNGHQVGPSPRTRT
jgi:hypothetical protein